MTDRLVIMPKAASAASGLKRRHILDTARRLLVHRGFQDVALDDVARAAGVAKGTLFLYYRSKDELFSAAFGDLVDQLGEALDALFRSGLRGDELLLSVFRLILGHFDRNRDFTSHFGAGKFPGCGARSCERLKDKMSENLGRLIRILRLCARDGIITSLNMEYSAAVVFGLCRAALVHKLLTRHEESLEAKAPQVLNVFLHGMGARR